MTSARRESAAGAASREAHPAGAGDRRQGPGRRVQRQPDQGRAAVRRRAPDADVQLELIGRKGRDFFRKRGVDDHRRAHRAVPPRSQYDDAAAIARKAIELFRNDEIDAVYLIYNEFKSVVAQKLTLTRVLPVEAAGAGRSRWITFTSSRRPRCWSAAAAVRRDGNLSRAAGIGRRRARRAHDRHGRGHVQRRRHDREADAVYEPRAPGQHHQGNHRSGQRRRRRWSKESYGNSTRRSGSRQSGPGGRTGRGLRVSRRPDSR